MDRLYACVGEIIYDLELSGLTARDEARMIERIRAASDWLDKKAGWFIPQTAVRRFDGPGGTVLFVDPLLAVTTLVDDTTTLTTADYLLYPRNRHWENGPYTRIEIDPDATSLTAWTHEADIIAITGRWGKYEESVATGAMVANTTSISASETALLVNDGSKLSAGMVLLIESEQALMETTGARTAATSLLNGALDSTQEDVVVDNGAEFNVNEVIRVGTEDMRIEAIATHTLTVKRGWNGTTKATHLNDAAITVYRTYTIKRGVNGTTAAIHTNGKAISRYVAPWDVNWICRQVAALMHKKARTGFAGKTANAELGEIFYMDEFPKKQVEDVVKNYRLTTI